MVIITVCIGSNCHLKGSAHIIDELKELIKENDLTGKVDIKASFCLGNCTSPISVKIDSGEIISVKKENIKEFFHTYVVSKI